MTYSEQEAVHYFQYARASFCTERHVQSWDCGDICHDAPIVPGAVHFLKSKLFGAQGYVARTSSTADNNECIVAFRGSVTPQNWISDFVAYLTPWNNDDWCPGCKVHAGVAKTYDALRNDMLEGIKKLKCEQVAFAGHSMGGGMVALASLDVHETLNLTVGPVYTYGMLRTGNQAFVDAYVRVAEKQGRYPPMWRLVHYYDPVPRLPPSDIYFLEYVHIPLEVYYTDRSNTEWEVCPSSNRTENKTCSAAVSLLKCSTSNPGVDHNQYLNMTTDFDALPKSCTSDQESSVVIV